MTPLHRPIAPPHTGSAPLRLVTFIPEGEAAPRIGVVKENEQVVDVPTVSTSVPLSFDPWSMLSLIASGDEGIRQVREVADAARGGHFLSKVRLLAPIPDPIRNVYAVGWNYQEHYNEGQKSHGKTIDFPQHPTFFTKASSSINGPYDPIPYDASISEKIDWECELAVVIGKGGINIAESQARSHVFGYAVINDTSARDFNKKHGGQWFKSKSLDGHGPFGPWIVPQSDIDAGNLRLLTRVNGIVKQDASTEQMFFKIERIIAELSFGMTLKPGDIIATGTPQGVGNSRTPPEFLKPGDIMETEIVGIGMLRNRIGAVQA